MSKRKDACKLLHRALSCPEHLPSHRRHDMERDRKNHLGESCDTVKKMA